MEENYELLAKVLTELQRQEALNGLVLVGSWCQYFYRILFNDAPEIPLIRTMDVDFLAPNPDLRFKQNVNVPSLFDAGIFAVLNNFKEVGAAHLMLAAFCPILYDKGRWQMPHVAVIGNKY